MEELTQEGLNRQTIQFRVAVENEGLLNGALVREKKGVGTFHQFTLQMKIKS